jgi:hypothetical protein
MSSNIQTSAGKQHLHFITTAASLHKTLTWDICSQTKDNPRDKGREDERGRDKGESARM